MSGYLFAKTLLETGHQINLVFFQHDSVYWGLKNISPPNDEINYQTEWLTLQEKYQLKLALCSGAAARRGIQTDNIPAAFEICGYGMLVDAMANSDKMVSFK